MNNKGANQPAHLRSLISAFVVRCLDSIIPLLAISRVSRPWLVSVAEQAGLSLTWSQTPKTGFLMARLILSFVLVHVSKFQSSTDPGVPNFRVKCCLYFIVVYSLLGDY